VEIIWNLLSNLTSILKKRGGKMNKLTIIFFLAVSLILSACQSINSNTEENILSGEKPPNAYIEIDNKRFDTKLGTYCWQTKGKGICVDTVGPVELLEGKKPGQVEPEEKITFVMDYHPKPNQFHVQQNGNGKETEVVVNQNQFNAPAQKGVYYYSYGVWWKDEKVEHLSHGDAFYAFVLEVK
jgi:hypothetical protein